jgi:NADH dehydrogenase FAD-containing subunit
MKFEYTQQYKNIFKKKNNINLTHKWVTEAFPKEKSLFMADNSSITFDKLVTATSYKSDKFD